MSQFQSNPSSPSGGALFSPQEIRRLMAAEFDRSQRFETPLAIIEISVDRLGYLHDLYGEESKFEILGEVNGLLRSSTRSSDLLGYPAGDRLLAAVPHIEARYAEALVERLISGTRGLTFDADGRTLRITASIGMAHSDEQYATFEDMAEAARAARREAVDGGGDRYVRRRPSVAASQAPTGTAPALPAPTAEIGGDVLLAETLRRALSGEGPTDLAQALLAKVLDEVETRFSQAGGDERHDLLERRVAKLGKMLENTEAQLRHVLTHSGEEGVASVYRDVQGLAGDESQVEHKRDLLKAIFDANLRMRRMQDEESS